MTDKQSPRVDYDKIAHLYDSQPYRDKEVDLNLLAFLDESSTRVSSALAILDLGCGTGNQLVANRSYVADALLVGLDLFHGMLRQARPKADDVYWVQANSTNLPFPDSRFDFVSNQFAFHHFRDKPAVVRAVFRILRPGGRFVMTNICPREVKDVSTLYRYFPSALEADLKDFLPKEVIVGLMRETGFYHVKTDLNHIRYEQSLREFWETVRRRDYLSQLITISDADYQVGLRRLEMELDQVGNRHIMIQTGTCLLTICADKP